MSGPSERGAGRLAEEKSVRTPGAGEHSVRVEAGQHDQLANEQSERAGSGRAGANSSLVLRLFF